MYGIPLAIHEIIARYVADICVDAEFFTKFNSMIHKIRPQILCPFEFNLKIVRAAVYDTRGPAVRRYNIPLGCMMPYKQFGIETNNLMLVGNDKIFRKFRSKKWTHIMPMFPADLNPLGGELVLEEMIADAEGHIMFIHEAILSLCDFPVPLKSERENAKYKR